MCIPTAKQNLISVSSFVKANNVSCEFFADYFLVKDLGTKAPLFKSLNEYGHCTLPASPLQFPIQSYSATLGDWHTRLGHASSSTVRRLVSSNNLGSDSSISSRSSLCQACVTSKIHKLPFSVSEYSARGPLDMICSDVRGPSPEISNDGFPYYFIYFLSL